MQRLDELLHDDVTSTLSPIKTRPKGREWLRSQPVEGPITSPILVDEELRLSSLVHPIPLFFIELGLYPARWPLCTFPNYIRRRTTVMLTSGFQTPSCPRLRSEFNQCIYVPAGDSARSY